MVPHQLIAFLTGFVSHLLWYLLLNNKQDYSSPTSTCTFMYMNEHIYISTSTLRPLFIMVCLLALINTLCLISYLICYCSSYQTPSSNSILYVIVRICTMYLYKLLWLVNLAWLLLLHSETSYPQAT